MKKKKASIQLKKDAAARDWRQRQQRNLEEGSFVAKQLAADAQHFVTAFKSFISQFSQESQPEPWRVFEFAVEVADLRRAELSRKTAEKFRDRAATASGISFEDAQAIIQVGEEMAAIRASEVNLPDDEEFHFKVEHLEHVIENIGDRSDTARRELREAQGTLDKLDEEKENASELLESICRDLQYVRAWRSRGLNAKKLPSS